MRGLSLAAASGGRSSSRCAGLSLSRPLLLRSTGSRRAGSVIVAHGPSCSTACGIFPDQGSNPCPLHWQADSQPLRHQGSPTVILLKVSLYHSSAQTLQWLVISLSAKSDVLMMVSGPLHGRPYLSSISHRAAPTSHSASAHRFPPSFSSTSSSGFCLCPSLCLK